MEFINAIILLLNYTIIPALTYGSQLALGAIFVTLVYGILRFANFATGDMMSFGTMFTILFTWYFESVDIGLGVIPTSLLAMVDASFGGKVGVNHNNYKNQIGFFENLEKPA